MRAEEAQPSAAFDWDDFTASLHHFWSSHLPMLQFWTGRIVVGIILVGFVYVLVVPGAGNGGSGRGRKGKRRQ